MRRCVLPLLVPLVISADVSCAMGSTADRWLEVRSTHFLVLTDSGEKDARHLANQFERMHMIFHTLLPTPGDDSDPLIVVLALKHREGMQALEPEAYLAKKQMDLAGLFLRVPEKNYILVRLDAPQEHPFSTVYHEYTHYILRKSDSWLPLWMNEGLAQFYENTDIDLKTAWLGETNAKQLRFLNRNDLLPIATLMKVDATSPYYRDEQKGSIFYAESWALTHYLIVSDRLQGTHHMRDYSKSLAAGEDAVSAAQLAFGDLGKLQAGLIDYMMQRKFMYFMMPIELPATDSTFEVRAVSAARVNAVRADVMAYTERSKEARALAESVLREDPDNLLAHETLGYLCYHDGDIEGAKKWYGEAVELDSHNYRANFYYGLTMQRGRDTGEDAAVELSFQEAIRLNPEFAPAYDALAMFYASRHHKLNEAHTLNLRAIELEPGRLSFRLNCAEVLAEKRQFDDAMGVLQGAMRLARTPAEVGAVTDRMVMVERYQTAMGGSPLKALDESGVGR